VGYKNPILFLLVIEQKIEVIGQIKMIEKQKQTEEEIKEEKRLYYIAEEKLIKARIRLQSRSPFFSYLALYLKFISDKNWNFNL